MNITKAVFPVAGFGTRFLPATKASPKEMLPIIDKPIIQYAVEEAVDLGIKNLIFITSNEKRAIEDHFDRNLHLERYLIDNMKQELLDSIDSIIPKGVSCIYLRQHQMLGLGHAILCAEPAIGNDPFIVSLADDLIYNEGKSCLAQMMEVYTKTGKSVIATQPIPKSDCDKYGMIEQDYVDGRAGKVKSIIEKPSIDKAPSNLAVVGRYIFSNNIFQYLKSNSPKDGSEIHITSAIDNLAKKDCVYSYNFEGNRYDCGDKFGYLKAVYDYSIRHPVFGNEFTKYVKSRIFS